MMMIDMFLYLVFFFLKENRGGWLVGACGRVGVGGLKRSCSHTKKNLVIT